MFNDKEEVARTISLDANVTGHVVEASSEGCNRCKGVPFVMTPSIADRCAGAAGFSDQHLTSGIDFYSVV